MNLLETIIKQYTVAKLPGFTPSPIAGAPPVILPFTMQRQQQSQWCWAATSASVSLFYNSGSTWNQCLVANAAFGLNCCSSPIPCNQPWYLDRALTIVGNFVSMSCTPTALAAVLGELLQGRVVCTRIGWAGGGGHVMAIYGATNSSGIDYLDVADPIYGNVHLAATTYETAYQGSGQWTHTYLTH